MTCGSEETVTTGGEGTGEGEGAGEGARELSSMIEPQSDRTVYGGKGKKGKKGKSKGKGKKTKGKKSKIRPGSAPVRRTSKRRSSKRSFSRRPQSAPASIGAKKLPWRHFVSQFYKRHKDERGYKNLGDAMKDPECSRLYKAQK